MSKRVAHIIGGPSVEVSSFTSLTKEQESDLNLGVDAVQFTCAKSGSVFTAPAASVFVVDSAE